ncbi:hypothetical protein LY01_01624 [Nonlabens xylanidelens]|uniref:Uncharacterized protein n=1 Tax=Nonlabens xylanidelens TaxID=191564 RepID=A0A2S6IL23_9FLAO|nr:hypothetical protein LY01_01624 [Nonlabens xylanidelens]
MFSAACTEQTVIKINDDSFHTLKSLINKDQYAGGVKSNGFEFRARRFPNNIEISVNESDDGTYIIVADFLFPFAYYAFLLITVGIFNYVFSYYFWTVIGISTFVILIVNNLISWSRQKHVDYFLMNYFKNKRGYSKSSANPNRY